MHSCTAQDVSAQRYLRAIQRKKCPGLQQAGRRQDMAHRHAALELHRLGLLKIACGRP